MQPDSCSADGGRTHLPHGLQLCPLEGHLKWPGREGAWWSHDVCQQAQHRTALCARQPVQYCDPCCCIAAGSWALRSGEQQMVQRHLFMLLQVAVLGTGTFGTVLRAVDTSVPAGQRRQRKEVAIKLLPRGGTGSQWLRLLSHRIAV